MPAAVAFHLFESAVGVCAVAWSPAGLREVSLHAVDGASLRERLSRRHPEATETTPKGAAAEAVRRIAQLLATGRDDLLDVQLDADGVGPFEMEVYRLTRAIAPGQTSTYGEVARRLGDVRQSRRVGQALGRNPWPIVVPCHRILGADGKVGGFSAPGGASTKLRLLEIERAATAKRPGLFADLPLAMRP